LLASLTLSSSEQFGWSLSGASDVAGVESSDGTTLTYSGILPETDLSLTSETYGVKESLTLASASAGNVWTFPLSLQGLSIGQGADGTWQLTDGSGAVVATLEAPYADDSAGTLSDPEPAETHSVTYSLATASDGTQDLVMTLDKAWLDDPARAFPVTVDPTTTVSINGQEETTYIDTGYPTSNYDSSMRMVIGEDPNGSGDVRRSFLYYPTSSIVDQGWHVSAAQFAAYMYAASDTASSYASYTLEAVHSPWSVSGLTASDLPNIAVYTPSVGSGTYSTNTTGSVTVSGTTYNGSWTYLNLDTSILNKFQWMSGNPYYGFELAATSDSDPYYSKWFTSSLYSGYAPYLYLTYTTDVPAQVTASTPSSGQAVQTLTPTLSVSATDSDLFPGATLQYQFCVYSGTTGKKLVCSASGSSNSYTIPAKLLRWGQAYEWIAYVFDGFQDSPVTWYSFTTTAPPPVLGGQQSSDTSGKGFNAATGDYTTSATDASVATAGPALSVKRAYNSLDQLSSGAFGTGWSTGIDAGVSQVLDGAGNLTEAVVTYPDGEDVAFGRESDGTYDAPEGRYATLTYSSSGGYTLVDRANTQYQFSHVLTAPVVSSTDSTKQTTAGVYGLTKVSDAQGRSLTYAWSATTGGNVSMETSSVSGRYLTFSWTKPANASYSHVQSVGVYSASGALAQTWGYGYSGDDLASVCAPGETNACTGYSYDTSSEPGSVYQETIVNSGAAQYWPLDEPAGSTSAPTRVAANYGSGELEYTGVGLGSQASPVAGSGATVATFANSNEYASSATSVVDTDGDFTVSAWAEVTSTSATQDVVTEDGAHNSEFFLQLIGDHWSFSRIASDSSTGSSGIRASATANATAGQWYFLTGTYVASTGTLTIYVNGAAVGSATDTTPFYDASGVLRIGRGFYAGNSTDWLTGSISDVAVWGTSLSAMQVGELYTAGHVTAPLLNKITRPNLANNANEADEADVTYYADSGRVKTVTDGAGGLYTVSEPWVGYSPRAYQADIAAYAPTFYWMLGDGASAKVAVNAVTDETTADGTGLDGTSEQAQYNGVTLGTDGSEFNTAASGSAPTYTAATFDGSTSFVKLPSDFLNELTTGSVALWFKTTTAGGVLLSTSVSALSSTGGVATTTSGYTPMLYVGNDGKLHGSFYTSPGYQYTSASAVDDGNWHMVVLTAGDPSTAPRGVQVCPSAEATVSPNPTGSPTVPVSGWPSPSPCPDASSSSPSPSSTDTPGSESMYVDGTAATTSLDPTITAATSQVNAYLGAGFIGGGWTNEAHYSTSSTTGTSQYFSGDMADVAIYRSALSDSAVSSLWNAYKQVALGGVDYYNAIDKVTVTAPLDSYDANVTGKSALPAAIYYYDPSNGMRNVATRDPFGAMTIYGYDTAGFLDTIVDRS
jgi:hypothetical protein